MRRMRLFSRLLILILLSVPLAASALDAQAQYPSPTCQIVFYRLRSRLNALAFRYDEAIADMDAAIALDPDSPALFVERGQRIILIYEWDRALADYDRALELAPNYADAYYYRGILYASVPEGIDARRAALADFQRSLDLAPAGQHAVDAARYRVDIGAQLDSLATAQPGS